jgi:hypothetical protein
MDIDFLVKQIRTPQQNLRLRQAEVVAINNDYTIDVKIAGDTGVLPNVRYLSDLAPLVGYHVWVVVDNNDMLAIGHVARETKTLAPTAYRTTDLTITKDVQTTVAFEAVRQDPWDMWDVADPTKLTVKVPGLYSATGAILFAGQNNMYASVCIELNGLEVGRSDGTASTKSHGYHSMVTTTPLQCEIGDYFQLRVLHDYNPSNALLISSGGVDHTGHFNALSVIYLGS